MSLAKAKQKVAQQRTPNAPQKRVPEHIQKTRTEVKVELPKVEKPKTVTELPMGYHAVGKNDVPMMEAVIEQVRKTGIMSFDYETTGDPEDDTQDPQDHEVVGVSISSVVGQAFYFPFGHVTYAANWDVHWFMEHILKPILEDDKIYVIVHNVKAEHQWSWLYNIDMFKKTPHRKAMDTMLLVKALSLPQDVNEMGEVVVGLKPATKAHLADGNGVIHGLLHVDDVKSFKDTVATYVAVGEYKSGAKKGQPKLEKKLRKFSEMPIDKTTIDYACSDADWALGLFYKLMPIAEKEGIDEVLYELDIPFMMVLGEYELAGWKINPDRLREMRKTAHTALYGEGGTEEAPKEGSIEYKLNEALLEVTHGYADFDDNGNVMVPEGRFPMGDWKGDPVALVIKSAKPFSWGSVQHKQWLFFHVLNISTMGLERSKSTGLPGTGKNNMDKIIDGYAGDSAFMKVLKEKAKYDKLLSTYVEGMLPYCREDTQKIHTNLNLVSTWRLSSKKPNLQNIGRADNDPLGVRSVFEAPYYDTKKSYEHLNAWTRPPEILVKENLSGHMVYITSDYSQIELKVLAWFAREQTMIQTLANGGDLHSAVAQEVFKLDCEVHEVKDKYKPFRYRAKAVNFGLCYGMTEFGLSKDPKMGMTVDEAKVFITNYMATYPGVREYAKSQIAFAREYGYVQTMFGHRRPIPEINSPNKWLRQAGENKSQNTPIQGSASDIIRLAMVNLRKRIPHEAPYLKGVMQVHDELFCECPIEYAAEGAKFLKEVMETPIEGFTDIMPIVSEPAVGKIWSHALDVSWDANGQAYVKPKKVKKEATDVTLDEIKYMLPYYEMAGIEVRV